MEITVVFIIRFNLEASNFFLCSEKCHVINRYLDEGWILKLEFKSLLDCVKNAYVKYLVPNWIVSLFLISFELMFV